MPRAIRNGAVAEYRFDATARASSSSFLAAPRRAAARVALQAGAVPHEREVAALAAGIALVAAEAGGGGALGLQRLGVPGRGRIVDAGGQVGKPRRGAALRG